MPGKLAARMGDIAMDCSDPVDTPTGTVIAAGTVMIEKMPAAKLNDKIVGTDFHILMIPTPGGPVPQPIPNPYCGAILKDTEPTVKIMGFPAAVVGSTAIGNPPHMPLGGPFQKPPTNMAKIIKGAATVFIGSGSPGGGPGGGGGAAAGGSDGIFDVSVSTKVDAYDVEEGHFLDVTFVDKGGNWIIGPSYHIKDTESNEQDGYLAGRIRKNGVEEGDCEIKLRNIIKAAWSTEGAKLGDAVKLQVETVGMDDGTAVIFEVWERDINRPDKKLETIETETIKGDKAEATWVSKTDNLSTGSGRSYSSPDYYFLVEIAYVRKRSGILCFEGKIDVQLIDEDNKPISKADYTLYLPTGEILKDQLDDNGKRTIENIGPRNARIKFPFVLNRIEGIAKDGAPLEEPSTTDALSPLGQSGEGKAKPSSEASTTQSEKDKPIRFQLYDQTGEIYAGKPYDVFLGGNRVTEKTDAMGWTADIDITGMFDGILAYDGIKFHFSVQSTTPSDTRLAKSALNALGYSCGAVDDEKNETTKKATEHFQKAYSLDVTGELESSTTDKLQQEHCVSLEEGEE